MFYLELLDSYFPSNVFSCKDLVLSFLHDLPFGLAEQMIVPKKSVIHGPGRSELKNIGPTSNRKSVLPNFD